MASTINLGDAKDLVKEKLDLQEKEQEFFNFERICESIYKFELCIAAQAKWNDLESTVASAQRLIEERWRKENMTLGDADVMHALSEWKLYQLHRAAKKKDDRAKKSANAVTAESSAYANHPRYQR